LPRKKKRKKREGGGFGSAHAIYTSERYGVGPFDPSRRQEEKEKRKGGAR